MFDGNFANCIVASLTSRFDSINSSNFRPPSRGNVVHHRDCFHHMHNSHVRRRHGSASDPVAGLLKLRLKRKRSTRPHSLPSRSLRSHTDLLITVVIPFSLTFKASDYFESALAVFWEMSPGLTLRIHTSSLKTDNTYILSRRVSEQQTIKNFNLLRCSRLTGFR